MKTLCQYFFGIYVLKKVLIRVSTNFNTAYLPKFQRAGFRNGRTKIHPVTVVTINESPVEGPTTSFSSFLSNLELYSDLIVALSPLLWEGDANPSSTDNLIHLTEEFLSGINDTIGYNNLGKLL